MSAQPLILNFVQVFWSPANTSTRRIITCTAVEITVLVIIEAVNTFEVFVYPLGFLKAAMAKAMANIWAKRMLIQKMTVGLRGVSLNTSPLMRMVKKETVRVVK